MVSCDVVGDEPEERGERTRASACIGAWKLPNRLDMLHKLRRAMVRPGRDRLRGEIEVDETYLGGPEEGLRGRGAEGKSAVVIAAEVRGRGTGRVRLRVVPDVSTESLLSFIQDVVEPGSVVVTDGWAAYRQLSEAGYTHRIQNIRRSGRSAHEMLPRVHRVASLLRRWILGTHQGGVGGKHLNYYLDEFTFRFNRRRSSHRGLLFFRLMEQAIDLEPLTYRDLVKIPAHGADSIPTADENGS